MRVRLSADYSRLEFLRILRHHGTEVIQDPGGLVGAPPGDTVPQPRPEGLGAESADGTAEAGNG